MSKMKNAVLFTLLVLLFSTLSAAKQPASKSHPQVQVFRCTDAAAFPVEELRPVLLPDGRMLIGIGDTVYMLDSEGRQLWKYSTPSGETLTSEPVFNPELNEVALTGIDLLFVRLDATTGRFKWKADSNGRATFTSVSPYGRGYLVVLDMSGYRENDKELHLKSVTLDQLSFWGISDDDFWSIDFPIGAELLVSGKNIYAVRQQRKQVKMQRLIPPEKGKNSEGR